MYIARKREDGKMQPLAEHLKGTAKRAASFADVFGAEQQAYYTGLLHDIGKYSPAGQKRMNDPEHTKKIDHATAGAQTALQRNEITAAFAIAGHHGGLPDQGSRADDTGAATLYGRKKKSLNGDFDYSAWKTEIAAAKNNSPYPVWLNPKDSYQMQFYIRMLFSCLVDADYLDTESFMQDDPPIRGCGETMKILHERLLAYIQPWLDHAETELNKKRSEILRRCLQGAEDPRGMYTLTVPTGGGKTVSSLGFALSHAVKHGLRRVIYVIPYTSIIEQNAAVFANILGEENVLEHHSNVDFREDKDDDEDIQQRRKRAASENWDAPIVVTTAVQFFESLYAAKPSRCRKLHNIADSVIIFDEAQMMPIEHLQPCVAAIAELVQHYGVTAVLCTATQPSLDDLLLKRAQQMQIREICPHKDEMMDFFRRVHFEWEAALNDETIAEQMSESRQVLCIVNTRKRARKIFELLPAESRFHLSTLMTPEHRSRILAEVRRRLKEREACHVVATSLIEAGVDVDFPQVWREEAGLDSILQAAGRCNREGKRKKEDCAVHVFGSENGIPKRIEINVKAMRGVMDREKQPDSYEAIQRYFKRLRKLYTIEGIDKEKIMDLCNIFSFRTIAERFRMIDTAAETIYIPSEENREQLDQLRSGAVTRSLLRRLGRSAVSVYPQQLNTLWGAGKIENFDGFYILADETAYSEECGLSPETDAGAAFYV